MGTKLKSKIIHIKSKQHNEDGSGPKLPTSDQLEYGELAINYGDGIETIAIKNENDEIVKFISEKCVQRLIKEGIEEKIQEVLNNLTDKKPVLDDDSVSSIDSGEY